MNDRRTTILMGMIALAGIVLLYDLGVEKYLAFHMFVEMFQAAVAWGIFFLAWNTRAYHRNSYLFTSGVGFLFTGIVGILHALAYKGMNILGDGGADLATQLWIANRYLSALIFLIAPLSARKLVPPRWAILIFTCATVLLIWSIFSGRFPTCFVEGAGLTPFKIWSEYATCAVMVGSIALLLGLRDMFDPSVLRLTLVSIALNAAASLAFTLYVDVYGFFNVTGHVLLAASFFLLYKALVETGQSRPLALLFHDLKSSKEALEESERRYRMIFENSPLGIARFDAEGTLLQANPRLAEMLNATPGELSSLNVLGWSRNQPVAEALRKSLEGGRSEFEGHIYSTLSGSETPIPVRMIFNPVLDDEGAVQGVIATFEDISARFQMEKLREDVERITRHDLRSPLQGIITLPRMLLAEPNLSDFHRKALMAISDAGNRMLGIVNDSLNLYKMESGAYRFEPKPMDLVALVRRVVEAIRLQRVHDMVDIRLLVNGREPTDGVAVLVPGEELLCHTLLQNLLDNAVEASPGGMPVTIAIDEEESSIRLSIHNQGVVPEAIRERFFEKFVTAGKKYGTGLGTYSARLIARTHGGDISLSTSEEHGTVVAVTLPVAA